MTAKFSDLLRELLKEWAKSEYKATNYIDTYSRNALLKFLSVVQDWTMFQHCVEDREAMTQRDKQDHEEWWEDAMIDKLAAEEQESRDAQVKDIPWNRIIMNSRVTKPNKKWEL